MTDDTQSVVPPGGTLESAIIYGHLGYRIFPCLPGRKEPALKEWQVRATNDVDQIGAWFDNNKGFNIGLACGPQPSGENLVVIDIDKKSGGLASWRALLAQNGGMPRTPANSTPNGGFHLFFDAPVDLANSRNKLGPGIDTRGSGGYVLVPPSRLVDEDGVIIGVYAPIEERGGLWFR